MLGAFNIIIIANVSKVAVIGINQLIVVQIGSYDRHRVIDKMGNNTTPHRPRPNKDITQV